MTPRESQFFSDCVLLSCYGSSPPITSYYPQLYVGSLGSRKVTGRSESGDGILGDSGSAVRRPDFSDGLSGLLSGMWLAGSRVGSWALLGARISWTHDLCITEIMKKYFRKSTVY